MDVRSVYYHFESKRDLLRSLFEQAGMLAALVQPVPQELLDLLKGATPMDALIAIVEGNLQMLHEGAPYSRLIHVEVLHDDEDAKVVGDEMWTSWGNQLEVLVREAGLAEGFWSWGLRPPAPEPAVGRFQRISTNGSDRGPAHTSGPGRGDRETSPCVEPL